MSRRTQRVNDLIRRELCDLLRRQVKDPRLCGLITLTEVSASPDLRYAKVYVSTLGGEAEKRQTLAALSTASGFLRRELGERLSLRYTPQLRFVLDESLERGSRLLELMRQVAPGDAEEI